ncbi:MAG: hypothetical protein ABIT64_00045 [Lysobacteraceae bacterium]
MLHAIRFLLLPLAASALLAGCSDDPPPAIADKPAAQDSHTELRDAMQRPLNRAKAVDDGVKKAKEQQDKDIDQQTNGG